LFENGVLRKIFGPKRNEVTRDWRKLHDEELNDCYSTQYYKCDQMKGDEIGRACSMYGESRVHTGF
jgi:hypothetical protein